MNITVSKSTAKALQQSIFFMLTGVIRPEKKEFDKENMKVLGLNENQVVELCKLHTKLKKELSQTSPKAKTLVSNQ